jgi:hypothetical protein
MKLRNFFSIALTVLMITAVFAGCGPAAPSVSKDFCFEATPVTTAGTDFQNIVSSAFNGNKFIISAYSTDYPEDKSDYDNYVQRNYLIAADETNGIVKKLELPDGYEKSYGSFYGAKNGIVYGIETSAIESVDADGNPVSQITNTLVTIDEELNITPVLDLGAVLVDFIPDMNISYASIREMKTDDSGNVYIWLERNFYVINMESGKVISSIPEMIGQSNITGLVESPDGGMSALIYGLETTPEGATALYNAIADIDTVTGMLGTYVPFPAEDYTFAGNEKYPYYTYNSSYIYGVDGETFEKTIVANLLASGSAGLEMHDVAYAADDKFAVRAADMSTHRIGTYMLNKLDPKDVPDKKLVTVAALTTDYVVDYYIKEFNRNSTEYQVELKKYAAEGMTEADQLMAFNAEFAAGNIPDVLLIDTNMNYHSYVSKKMFKDLYPLLDKDPDISRDDLVQSVMKSLETDGKLYSVIPHYNLMTFVGKTEIFGENKGQSIAELQAAGAKIPGAKMLAGYETADNVVTVYTIYSLSDFVDYEKGECYFDTPEFIALLEAAKKYPLEIDYATFTFDYMAYLASFANDEYLLYDTGIYDFRNITDFEHANFDAPVTLLGYPDKSGCSGALIWPIDELAILDKAKNPEGAWEFVKGFMQYKGPENTETSSYSKTLSIMKNNMDDFAAEAMEDPYYTDYTTGEKVYSVHRTFLNGAILELPNNTAEQNAKVFELLDSVTEICRNDEALRKIISDDADPFFRGQTTAEDAAKMIQNRVKTYLEEIQ